MKRRNFFRSIALGGVGAALTPVTKATSLFPQQKQKPATNLEQARSIPRNERSMPGLYPGKVVKTNCATCIVDGKPSEAAAYRMLEAGMLELTGASDLRSAWSRFVGPEEPRYLGSPGGRLEGIRLCCRELPRDPDHRHGVSG